MKIVIKILLFNICLNGFGQEKPDSILNKPKAFIELGTYLSTSKTLPFWLRSNQYGIVPNESPILQIRAGVQQDFQIQNDNKKSFSWGYGIESATNISKTKQPLVPEAYIKAKYGWFDMYAGRKREIVGLVDSTLSSGSYIWSGNALPIPKVQISWEDYKPILGKGFVSLKGSYAHGWFGNQTYVKGYYLHQKTLYGRLGKPNSKVHFYAGFNHQVQWGGEPKYQASSYTAPNGKFVSDFKSYLNIITGRSLVLSQGITNPTHDNENRAGNHLGTLDLGFDINLKNAKILLYRQNIYEDGSLYYLANIEDGLNGISVTLPQSKYIKKVLVEFLNTSDQGKSNNPKNPTDNDYYFQHGQYLNGWTYNNQVIGNPFMLYSAENNNSMKKTMVLTRENFINTRVQAYYLALNGEVENIRFFSKLSYSRNLGSYTTKPKVEQISYFLSAQKDINIQDSINLQFSFDRGSLFKNNAGLSFHFKRKL